MAIPQTDGVVPLTEDIVKRPQREYEPTFMEWASDNIQQISVGGQYSSTTTLYTIPDNYTLFITSATLSAACTSGVASSRLAHLSITTPETLLLACRIRGANSQTSNSISFPMPIKVNTGSSISITLSANTRCSVAFHGFLLPKKISIR